MNTILAPLDPQPPKGMKYVLGGESWKDPADRSPIRLVVEEWGVDGCWTKGGFNCRVTEFLAPPGARGIEEKDGMLHWSTRDSYGNPPTP
jgi:hypothetical protein